MNVRVPTDLEIQSNLRNAPPLNGIQKLHSSLSLWKMPLFFILHAQFQKKKSIPFLRTGVLFSRFLLSKIRSQ
jgi:hypothetical protein